MGPSKPSIEGNFPEGNDLSSFGEKIIFKFSFEVLIFHLKNLHK